MRLHRFFKKVFLEDPSIKCCMNSKYNFSLPASQSAMVSLKSTLSKIPLKMQKWVKWSAENILWGYFVSKWRDKYFKFEKMLRLLWYFCSMKLQIEAYSIRAKNVETTLENLLDSWKIYNSIIYVFIAVAPFLAQKKSSVKCRKIA